jgi:tRNA-specific 2-thiouridylase
MSKVCVALSGGVDSAVAAYLLKKEGHSVIAAFIKVWQPDFLACTQEEDRIAAKKVAAFLGIPFYVVDASIEYKKSIVDYMTNSYKHGETPNPDVLCNKEIKFGVLYAWAKQNGCEYIATGHHAYVDHSRNAALIRGIDPKKDQSYFVWQLHQDILKHTLMPIGKLLKTHVRQIAAEVRLPVFNRKESQGLCFLGSVDMREFLTHSITPRVGDVLSVNGDVIGQHSGAHSFTIGQRHGFTLNSQMRVDTPMYVHEIDIKNNTLLVSERVPAGSQEYVLRECVFRDTDVQLVTAQFRYHGVEIPARFENRGDGTARVFLESPVVVAKGQSCVMYSGDVCIGGGIVDEFK